MSIEILKALTQLFAIITKQDGGVTEKERKFIISFFEQELDQDSVKEYLEQYDKESGYLETREKKEGETITNKKPSFQESIQILEICNTVNKTLSQKQKVIVLIRIIELINSDDNFTPMRVEIVDIIRTVFNISSEEYRILESLITQEDLKDFNDDHILIAGKEVDSQDKYKSYHIEIDGSLIFLRIDSVDMYFVKYLGDEKLTLNTRSMIKGKPYLYTHGSTIKTPLGVAMYYSDLISLYNEESHTTKLSFHADIEEYKFPNGTIGLRDIHIMEGPGKLIGIMGSSGAGKTTLLNVLAGIKKTGKGTIKINGLDIHQKKKNIHGVIGYVSQDDLLIEELTVYDNLYYNAKLCFGNLPEGEINTLVIDVLKRLGLDHKKHLKVGSVLDKTISGGQRKRLNIALELIREPAIMFIDEPTSGLSSRDSENVIDLLKELSLKGKLIFVVIHQPSSDIYKMFDKMYIMDTGGYPVFYGNPIEAITYFKEVSQQVDSHRGQCEVCGNVSPEQVFNIIEAKVVDEFGQFTSKRKVTPMQWHGIFKNRFNPKKVKDVSEKPPQSLHVPSKFKQTILFAIRDMLSKISNKQYLLINLLEAPLLALILSFIIRYKSSPADNAYIFRFNENIPAYMLISIIVALFMGLSVSAEEIIRDRKILKREAFLNLSWNSYLMSKLAILFLLSAIQTFSFVLIGNLILNIQDMVFPFWLILFSCSCFANVLGLNISSGFNSAITVYIIIPLILIPQMILSGLLFNFNKLNDAISTKGKVPLIADAMASRWAYEAMAVYQFKNNDYQKPYYPFEKIEAEADFKSAYLAESLSEKRRFISTYNGSHNDSIKKQVANNLSIIKDNLIKEPYQKGLEGINLEKLTPEKYNPTINSQLNDYLDGYKNHYQNVYNETVRKRENMIYFFTSNPDYDYDLNTYKNKYYNEKLADLVTNVSEKNRILEYEGKLIQQVNPIFNDPDLPENRWDYRAHFFAPTKHFLGYYIDTYYFNIIVVWIMAIILYITLYFQLIRRVLWFFSNY